MDDPSLENLVEVVMSILVLVGVAIVVAAIGIGLYSLALQKKAVGTQDDGMTIVNESLQLSRDAAQRAAQTVELTRELVALQKEANRLLSILAREPH